MSEILLVNPRRRRRATKKRVARKRPAKRRVRRVARKANPVRRRRRASVRRVSRRATRGRRRNPIVSANTVKGQLKTATTGALGALGLDMALAYLPLPASIIGGTIGKVTKAAAAIGLGIVANKLGVSAANANRMAEGALTVQLHGIGKGLLAQYVPQVALSEYLSDEGLGYQGSGWNPSVIDNPDWTSGMSAYLPDAVGVQNGVNNGVGMYEY